MTQTAGIDEDTAQQLGALWAHRLLNTLGVASYAVDQLDRRGEGLSAASRMQARRDIERAIADAAELARLLLRHPTLIADDTTLHPHG
jgi:hypothetical protein